MCSIGSTRRVWCNQAAKDCLEPEDAGAVFEEIINVTAGVKAMQMYESGDITCGILSCGQGIGLAKNIPTVEELLDQITLDADSLSPWHFDI